jgi:hypothetical protein
MAQLMTTYKEEEDSVNRCSSHRKLKSHLVVLKFASNDSERVVDGVVVDVHFGHALRRAAGHPPLVAVIVDHNGGPRGHNGMLTATAKESG